MDRVLTLPFSGWMPGAERLRFPVRRRLDELQELLEGDTVFCLGGDDDGGDGGSSGDGAQGGDGGGAQGGGDGDGDDAPGGDDDADKETLTPEQARKLRSENRNLRQRAKDAEVKAKTLEDKDLEENDRLKRDLDVERKARTEAEARARSRDVRLAAIDAGIRPQATAAAEALIDWTDVDTDDEKAVGDALKGLKKEHEYLFTADDDPAKRRGTADGGKRSGSPSDKAVSPGTGRLRQAYANKD